MNSPRISIIIPTLNEAENLPLLVPRIANALANWTYQIIIVDDDSRDNTVEVCAELSRRFPLVLLLRNRPVHGLSGAVLHGFEYATGDVFVVMDADLQHPPEKILELVQTVISFQSDFALGSRFAGGTTDEKWGLFRRFNSWVATSLAWPFAGKVRDPMSGFFAIRRETFQQAQRLSPLGYKIALELMCKCRVKNVREIPIHFAIRRHGKSKLTLKQQFNYLQHLSRLYDFTFPRASPMVKFGIVLGLGLSTAAVVFYLLLSAGVAMTAAAIAAYLGHLLLTAAFHARYIRTQREFLLTRRPWVDFVIIAAAEMLTVSVMAYGLLHRVVDLKGHEMLLGVFVAGTIIRYIMRKEMLQDVRGLRQELRMGDLMRRE